MVNATEIKGEREENMEYWGRRVVQFCTGRSGKTSPRVMFEEVLEEREDRPVALAGERTSQAEGQGASGYTSGGRDTQDMELLLQGS